MDAFDVVDAEVVERQSRRVEEVKNVDVDVLKLAINRSLKQRKKQ